MREMLGTSKVRYKQWDRNAPATISRKKKLHKLGKEIKKQKVEGRAERLEKMNH